jgi:LEA14-like dessication related protein
MKQFIYLLIFGFFTLGSCSIEDPEIAGFENVKILKADGDIIEASIDVTIENPNFFGMKVKKSSFHIRANDLEIGDVELSKKFKVKRKSTKVYTLPLHISLAKGALFKIMKLTGAKEITLNLEGNVKGSVYGISKTVAIKETKIIDGKLLKFPGLE